ncbi:MAG: translocation/assembly module TamB [Prolixibacteraceae bacterium]|nr:translocation/assembly module TamB [Prolixibacteraceae bacterium]
MISAKTLIRRTVKIILWIIISVILLFVVLAALIQIPSIQTKIVQTATTFVSNKTQTKVELDRVSISFPKSVVVEGLYLEDTRQDTLVYAGKVKVNIALADLLSKKITINSFALDDATVKLYNSKTDKVFNYNFLTTAFSDTTTKVKPDTVSAAWTYSLDKVKLQNIRFLYHDNYAAMNVTVEVEESALHVGVIDLEESVFKIDEMLMDGLTASVKQTSTSNRTTNDSTSAMPSISFHALQLTNSTIHYADSVAFLSLMADFNRLGIDDGFIDLEKELLSVDAIDISKSAIRYHSFGPELVSEASESTASSNWKIAVDKIKMDENSIIYQLGSKPVPKNEFNANYLKFDKLSLEAEKFYYATDLTTILLQQFSAIDQNGFEISSLSAGFNMNKQSISANKLKLKTPNSSFDVDFNLEFESLDKLMETYQFSKLNLEMRDISVKNNDVLYFNPALNEHQFFQNRKNITTITGKVIGPVDQLKGENLKVETGKKTLLETDFNISGLPQMETAVFDFPNLTIHTVKKDLMMVGSYIPEDIEIPETIDLQLAYKGTMKSFDTNATMSSSFGGASLSASIDAEENFNGTVSLKKLDLGKLLNDTLFYGPVSLTANATGQGLDMETMRGRVEAEATQLYLNQYNYQNLVLDGTVDGQQFEGTVNLDDENAVFDFEGLVNLVDGEEKYNFKLDMLGADLQELHFADKDVRMSFVAEAGFQGGSLNEMNGTAGISNIVVVSDNNTYRLESLLAESVNEPGKSELSISSALIGMEYAGNISPLALPGVLAGFINSYFPVSDSIPEAAKSEHSKFNFEVKIHNHPILSDLLLPGLDEFVPGSITGSFDSELNKLEMDASIRKMVYGTTEIRDFEFDVNADDATLNYNVSTQNIANAQMRLSNLLIDGKLEDNQMTTTISSVDEKQFKKLSIRSIITKEGENYKLALDPGEFYLMDKRWDIAPGNFIEFGKQGVLVHKLNMNNAESRVSITSVNKRFNDDLKVDIQNFKLSDLSNIVTKDSNLVTGVIDGSVLFKHINDSYGIIADAGISNLFFRNAHVGNLLVKAENAPPEQFNIDLNLSGAGNNLSAKGYYIPNGGSNSIDIKTRVESLSMKTLEAFSMGQISETSGMISGDVLIVGDAGRPEITGELVFNDAFLNPAFLNNRIALKQETIQLKNDGVYFNNFTVSDPRNNTAVLNGAVKMEQFSNFKFDFNVSSKDFILFNTTANDNSEFFGRMIIDSQIDVSGPMDLPVVNARLKMKKGSRFTFVVPEDRLTTDKGEDVVEFNTGEKLNPILAQAKHKKFQKTQIKGLDVSSVIEVDKEATLRLLMDPTSTDSLVVKGEAALGFNIDQSGMMSLTGAYNLSEGSYLVSLESIIKKQFDIVGGSTIIWNGDPLDADININARHTVRASPYDLIADQLSDLSDVERNSYKQRYPFDVVLKLRGEILQPEISFEIQLAPEDKGIMGGSVDQKLSLLNNDPSGLNKQVFALLVLGRFVQENPFESELGSPSAMIRTSVGKFLSAQLNQLSSKVIPGMELNFDIQSYDNYESGQAEGRTQVEIGLKKQMFNERLSVQVGGTVDVEGEEAKHNTTSDIASDITVEYKLNKDGSLRLKGFRHDQYEGAIEGQLVETGVGLMYVRDFNQWKRFFKRKRKHVDAP